MLLKNYVYIMLTHVYTLFAKLYYVHFSLLKIRKYIVYFI
jgi:hypothetical protein